ncbi:ABC transporter substrate-binding protein [Aquabacter sp. CN5-332]|uniref:ABC transporter substrate-binding protein n=1 Tax=Aquabacter sp. CN5-332 TaxID=3156608 RepID=UPI0032B3B647
MTRIGTLLTAMILAASVPLAGASAQAPKTEVKLAVLAPSALLWLHAIAEQKGFYAKRNLEIRELRASDSPALLQAVASGSADAGISLGDLAVRAVDKGAPVIIAGAVLDKTILRLYGAKGTASIKALAGKPLTAGAVKGGTANLLKYQLLQAGVDPAGVQMVSIANSRDRIIAMGNGQVAGALLIAPFDTLAAQEGAVLLDVYHEPYVQTPLVVNKTWANAPATRPTAIALTQALKEAAAFINDPANKDAAIDVLSSYTKTPRDVCVDSYAFIVQEQKAIPADLSVPAAGLENLFKIDAAVGGEPPTQAFVLSRYYDPSFIAGK